MFARDFLEPAQVYGTRDTLISAAASLGRGRPALFRLGADWRAVLPCHTVGYPGTRRLIDLKHVSVLPLEPTTAAIAIVCGDHEMEYLPVVEADRLLGLLRLRDLLVALSKPRSDELAAPQMWLAAENAGSLVHDISNALHIIELVLVAVSERPNDADAIATAQAALEHATCLADQFRRLSSRQPVQEPTMLDVNQTISKFQRVMNLALGPDFDLQLDLATDLPRVRAHPWIIERCLLNLLRNARAACGDSGCIRIATGSEADGMVSLSIDDDGPGIPGDLERVFALHVTGRPGCGTGIGLAAVRRAVAGLGGTVAAVRLARGTRMKLSLPCSTELSSDAVFD